jgi:hypothetical protein
MSEALYQNELEKLYIGLSLGEKAVTISLKPTFKPVFELPDVIDFVRRVISESFHAVVLSAKT